MSPLIKNDYSHYYTMKETVFQAGIAIFYQKSGLPPFNIIFLQKALYRAAKKCYNKV